MPVVSGRHMQGDSFDLAVGMLQEHRVGGTEWEQIHCRLRFEGCVVSVESHIAGDCILADHARHLGQQLGSGIGLQHWCYRRLCAEDILARRCP